MAGPSDRDGAKLLPDTAFAEVILAGRRAVAAHRASLGLETTKWTGVGVGQGFRVEVAPAYPMKRAKRAGGVRGRKAAKAFRRLWRSAHGAGVEATE